MKLRDLLEKGPIIGAPKGSQKDSRMGTDDPSKYMRGGEWEAYREPQGVNSNAGKIAGGRKKGTTKTKNKKVSETLGNSIEYYSDQGLMANPDRNYTNRLMQNAISKGGHDPHLKGFYDPRGTFWVWDGESDSVHHSEVEVAIVEKYGPPDFHDFLEVIEPSLRAEGMSEDDAEEFYNNEGGMIPFIILPLDKQGGIGNVWAAFPSAEKQPEVRRALESVYSDKKQFNYRWVPAMLPDPDGAPAPAPYSAPKPGEDGIRHIIQFGVNDDMKDKAHKKDKRRKKQLKNKGAIKEGLQPSGAGDSNDIVSRNGVGMTMDLVTDTNKETRTKSKLPGSEAPTKKVLKTVKKSLDNRPGNVSDINEKVDAIVTEAIPRVMPRDYSADYELMDDKSEEVIGVAKIEHGVIEILSVRNDLAEDYEGHIMSRLLSTIVRDADLADANLAIAMDNPNNLGQKRFMERFGFRDTGKGILKRNAGSVTPPSVLTARL